MVANNPILLEIRRPYETTFTDVTSIIPVSAVDYQLDVDKQGILSFETETSNEALSYLIPGAEVRLTLSEYGALNTSPNFQGFIQNDYSPAIEQGAVQKISIEILGPLDYLDRIFIRDAISNETITSKIRRLINTAKNHIDGSNLFIPVSRFDNDDTIAEEKLGKSVFSALISALSNSTLVDATDILNIRFPHVYPVFQINSRPSIVSEIEPDVSGSGTPDFTLTDSEIISIFTNDIPEMYTSVVAKYEENQKIIDFENQLRAYGRRELLSTSKKDMAEAFDDGIIETIKKFKPVVAYEVTIRRLEGIYLNKNVRINSAIAGIDEQFVVLGIHCSADPVPMYDIQLGFNFQRLEDFL